MPLGGSKSGEAAAALAVLGYGSQEISTALKGIDMDALPLEEMHPAGAEENGKVT